MADLRDKIKKLLKLAESPNEHEAKAALIKARELMAEHKLTEAECMDFKYKEVKRIQTEWTFSKRRSPWMMELSAVIGEHYCCKAFRTHTYGSKTYGIGFIGLEGDIDVCIDIFRYAVGFLEGRTKIMKKELSDTYGIYAANKACNSFGYGFMNGLAAAYKAQEKAHSGEEGWALTLVMPKEVQEAVKGMGHARFNAKASKEIHRGSYQKGYVSGKEFGNTPGLKDKKEEDYCLE